MKYIVIILFLSLSHLVLAAEYTPPKLAVEDSWPPYADETGRGIATSLVVEAYRAVDIQPEITVSPYARVLASVESGRVDGGYNVTRQTSTEALFHFENTPLLKASASFFTNPTKDYDFISIENVPDKFRIGLIFDYEYGDLYEKERGRFSEVRVNTQQQLIQMLLSDRIDAIILFDEVAKFNLIELGLEESRLKKQFTNHVSDIYVAFTKQDRVSKYWARELERGLNIIQKNGTYDKVFKGAIVSDYLPTQGEE